MLPMSDGGPSCHHRIPILCSSSTAASPATDSYIRTNGRGIGRVHFIQHDISEIWYNMRRMRGMSQ